MSRGSGTYARARKRLRAQQEFGEAWRALSEKHPDETTEQIRQHYEKGER